MELCKLEAIFPIFWCDSHLNQWLKQQPIEFKMLLQWGSELVGILLPHIKYKGLLGSLCNYNYEACWPVVHVQYKHETVTRMGDGVNSLHIYITSSVKLKNHVS